VYAKKLLHPSHWDHVIINRLAATVHLMLHQHSQALVEAATAHTVAMELHHGDDALLSELETLLVGAMCRANEAPSPSLLGLLEERVMSLMHRFGETSDRLVRPMQTLAEAHYLNGDTARAHHSLSRALKIADSVNFIFLLGNLLQPVAQLSVAEAQERNRISRDRMHTALALLFSETLFQIASLFDTEGKADEAQSTYLQALATIEISGVGNSLGVVQILSALAMLLYSEGHYGDALAYGERAHSILLEHFATMRVAIESVTDILRVIHYKLRHNGYALMRHPDSRHRFTTYL
jgi:tetratricopeptide (TPR) repeat protein